MNKNKELFNEGIKFMQQKKFKDAADIFDILLLKDQKNVDYNMYMALCQQNMGQLLKAEELYLYALDKRPNDTKIIGALYKLYNEDFKDYEKAGKYIYQLVNEMRGKDQAKYKDYQMKYIKILQANQERDKLGEQFIEIMKSDQSDIESVVFISEIYIQLKILLKELDLMEPSKQKILQLLSQKLSRCSPRGQVKRLEAIFQLIKVNTLKNFHDFEPEFICKSTYFQAIVELQMLFPMSITFLQEILKFIHCFIEQNIINPLKISITLLLQNEFYEARPKDLTILQNNFISCQAEVPELYEATAKSAKVFISFCKYFASDFLTSGGFGEQKKALDWLVGVQQIDISENDKPTILELPIKSHQLFRTNNQSTLPEANKLLTKFNEKVKDMKKSKLNCNMLDEISANLGYDVLIDPGQLLEMKNLLKVRINNKTFALETYEKYFDYQMKIVKMLRIYDEEISMISIFDKILIDSPQNLRIQIEKEWLLFSQNQNKENQVENIFNLYQEIIEKKPKGLNFEIEITLLKRLGTMSLLYQKGNSEIYFQKIGQITEDYQVLFSLGVIKFHKQQYSEALDLLYRAFNLCQTDYFLNQVILFSLSIMDFKDQAVEFANNLYKLPEFQNVFWVNIIIVQSLMRKGNFLKAAEVMQKAVDLFSFYSQKTYKVYFEKKLEIQDFAQPYLISQNENYFLSDYPCFSNAYFSKFEMEIFSDLYFQINPAIKLFQLEVKLSEIQKILGYQGSSLKSLQNAEIKLCQKHTTTESTKQIRLLDKYLKMDLKNFQLTNLVQIVQLYNKATIRSKFISTQNLKNINLDMAYYVMILCFEQMQLNYYCQQEYFAQEKFIQAILCAIYLEENKIKNVVQLVENYLPFIFEMASKFIIQAFQFYGLSQAIQLSGLYKQIYSLSNINTMYAYECYRDFSFTLGFLHKDVTYYEQSLKFSQKAIKILIGCDIIEDPSQRNLNLAFEVIQVSEHKKHLLKNNLFTACLVLINCLMIYNKAEDKKKLDQLLLFGVQLFNQNEDFYMLLALSNNDNKQIKCGFLLKALKFNPRCTNSLNFMALEVLKDKNLEWSQQLFLKSIETNPQSSVAYLGLILIGLEYLKLNSQLYNKLLIDEEPDVYKRNQSFQFLIEQQQILTQKIESYLKYVQTLENKPFSNFIHLIARHLLIGTKLEEDEKQNIDYLIKYYSHQIPVYFKDIIDVETKLISEKNDQTQNIHQLMKEQGQYIIQNGFDKLKEGLQLLNQKQNYVNIKTYATDLQNTLRFILMVLVKIQETSIDNEDEATFSIKSIKEIFYENFFLTLQRNMNQTSFATFLINFNQDFYNAIELSFRIIRKLNIQFKNKFSDIYQFSQNIRDETKKIIDTLDSGNQIVNYIDQIMSSQTEYTSDPHLQYRNEFIKQIMDKEPTGSKIREAQKQLKICIILRPGCQKYRNILNKMRNLTRQDQFFNFSQSLKASKISILERSPHLEIKWLDLTIFQMSKLNPQSETYESDVYNIIRIIKHKLHSVKDKEIQSSIVKILIDLKHTIQFFPVKNNLLKVEIENLISLADEPAKQTYISLSRSMVSLQKGDLVTVRNEIRILEDHIQSIQDEFLYSKKISTILTPLIITLYKINPTNLNKDLNQLLLQHTQYAQQGEQYLTKSSLKRNQFSLNIIIYNYILQGFGKEENTQELIQLKETADKVDKINQIFKFLNQGTFNSLSLSLYIHYTLVTEKNDELESWLHLVQAYLHNDDPIIQWASIVNCKNYTLRISKLLPKKQQNIHLTSFNDVVYVRLSYDVTSRTFIIIFKGGYPNQVLIGMFILPMLSQQYYELPSATQGGQKQLHQKKKKKLKQYVEPQDQQEKLRELKKQEKQGGLNSDTDEQVVAVMDYENDIEENQHLQQYIPSGTTGYDGYQTEEYMHAMFQQYPPQMLQMIYQQQGYTQEMIDQQLQQQMEINQEQQDVQY